jgi:hypothetical protein
MPDPSFWLVANSSKLNVLRLKEDGTMICGHFGLPPSSNQQRQQRSKSGCAAERLSGKL